MNECKPLDQVAQLRALGVPAHALTQATPADEQSRIMHMLEYGTTGGGRTDGGGGGGGRKGGRGKRGREAQEKEEQDDDDDEEEEEGGRGLHSSTSKLNVSTFGPMCWGAWLISVTKSAQVEQRCGRV